MASKKKKVQYDVVVETMNTGEAGYDGSIFLTLIGSAGSSGELTLSKVKWFRDDFGQGTTESLSVEGADVGDFYAIRLRIGNTVDPWKPGIVKVTKQDGAIGLFPCYQWVTNDIVVREAKASLAFEDNKDLLALRQEEIQKWRDLLPWHPWESLPSYPDYPTHDDLPRDLQFESSKRRDMNDYRKEGVYNFLMQKVIDFFKDIETFFDYAKFFKAGVNDGKVPDVAQRWHTDREFGRQFLQGVHPTVLRRVEKELPKKFPVTDDHVRGSLGRSVTLQQAINAGHIYMADYEMLVGISVAEGRYVTPAMALFYVSAADNLMPIAIQLNQEPGTGNPIWTPDDPYNDWLTAKLFLKCADAQIHEILGHLLRTHLIMEPVLAAMLRNVPRCHPLFKLLIPHMRYTIAINTLGRVTLVGAGGFVDRGMAIGGGGHLDLIRLGYRKFDWRLLNVPYALAQRKVEDPAKLPRYYYRDDALKLWQAMKAFVEEVVKVYYKGGDGDVKKDTELQSWIEDVHKNGLLQHGLEGEVDHHVPKSIDSVCDLIEFLTCVIFCCSAQHSAENFGQFDYYSFNPNAPMIMRQPPPTKKGEMTHDKVVASLGTVDDACTQIAATWTLAAFSEDEVFLGNYPERHFKEEGALKAIEGFQGELSKIEAEIDKRNDGIEVPYVYLKPSRVPNSIAV